MKQQYNLKKYMLLASFIEIIGYKSENTANKMEQMDLSLSTKEMLMSNNGRLKI